MHYIDCKSHESELTSNRILFNLSYKVQVWLLVIFAFGGGHTHAHTHACLHVHAPHTHTHAWHTHRRTHLHERDFKKPRARQPVVGVYLVMHCRHTISSKRSVVQNVYNINKMNVLGNSAS